MQLLQLAAGLETQLVTQERASLLVHGEPFRLASRPVERHHQLRAEMLPKRMLGSESFELGNECQLTAEREVRVDSLLDRPKPKLLEALHFEAAERLELQVGERTTLPELLRRSQQSCGRRRTPRTECLTPLRGQLLEALEIELTRLEAQQVTRCPRRESRLVAARGGKHLAQSGDVITERVVGGVPTLLRKDLGDQPVA